MPIDMQNELKKEISKYLKEIRKRLPGGKDSKTEFIDGLTEQIEDFVAENEDATFHDILLTFGEAKEIADEYSAGIDAQEIKKSLGFKRIVTVVLIAALLIWSVCAVVGATISRTEETGNSVVIIKSTDKD